MSEPVKIHWKKGKDLTSGLTDAAFRLGEERKKLAVDTSDVEARKKETKTKAYKELSQKIETTTDASVSFFGLFAFVSGYRWISAQESEQAVNEEREKVEKIKRGEKVEEDEGEDEDDAVDYQEIEVFPGGDEIATIIAEDMWLNAIKYYSTLPNLHIHQLESNCSQRLLTMRTMRTMMMMRNSQMLWMTVTTTPIKNKWTFEPWLAKAEILEIHHQRRSKERLDHLPIVTTASSMLSHLRFHT